MEVSNEKLKYYTTLLMKSRMRLLCDSGFYGLLLMHIKMNISDEKKTAWTDLNDRFYFNPQFLEQISSMELDYVLMHLLLHVVLKHLERKEYYDDKYFDQAADIVGNSNILRSAQGDLSSICINAYGGIQPHRVPGGDDGWKYSVEEVCHMLKAANDSEYDDDECEADSDSKSGLGNGYKDSSKKGQENGRQRMNMSFSKSLEEYSGWDYHNREREAKGIDGNLQHEIWRERILQAASAMQKRNSIKNVGQIPAFAERYIEELNKTQIDWRTVLDEFIQEEINDYSFCPPDRRFDDSPFFLPDFNEKDYRIAKVLFMIDTSGSMSDDEISLCYSEIKGAIDQFNGKLEGWLGFFDAVVVEPKPFVDEDEFIAIRPEGGGGTRFDIIFNYVAKHMADEPPVSIVILTDGYATFPAECIAHGIPVLWIIDNEDVTPLWGKVARIHKRNS